MAAALQVDDIFQKKIIFTQSVTEQFSEPARSHLLNILDRNYPQFLQEKVLPVWRPVVSPVGSGSVPGVSDTAPLADY